MKLTRLFLIIGMLLILPASVLGATQILDTFDRADAPMSGTSPQGVIWTPDFPTAPSGCAITSTTQWGTGRGDNAACVATNLGNTSIYRINYSIYVAGSCSGGSGQCGGSVQFRNAAGQIIAGHMWEGANHYYGSSWLASSIGSSATSSQRLYLIEFNATNNEYQINLTSSGISTGWLSAHNSFTEVASMGHNILHCASCGANAEDYIDYFIASYTGASPPGNTHPHITPIANQTMLEDTTLTNVLFNVSDAEDSVINLTVTATSSNTGLVPNANIFLGGHLGQRHLNITPLADQFGNTTINVTVNDTGGLTNSSLFNLEVLNVNDPPTITPINSKVMIEGQKINIGFNVSDIDTPYTLLVYSTSFTNGILFSNYTFSNFNASAQEYNLTANQPTFGKSDIAIFVTDGEFAVNSTFLTTVNCNTTTRYNTTFNDPPTQPELQDMCYDIDVSFNLDTDILNYNYTDYGGTVNKSWIYVYKTTGGVNQELDYETSENLTATWYFDYSGTNPNDDFAVYGWGKFLNRTFVSGDTDINVFYNTYSQVASLNTFFSKSDGLMYALLILVLFATIGVASQSATLSLILSLVGLWLASKFVLDVPEEFLWISGALVLFLLWYIAKLRVD